MMLINVLLIFIGFFIITWGKHKNKEHRKLPIPTYQDTIRICEKVTGVPKNMANEFFQEGEMYDDYSFKCFLGCLFQVTGKMSENTIVVEKVLNGLNHTEADEDLLQYWRETVPICAQMDESDVCEHVFTFLKCLKQHPEL